MPRRKRRRSPQVFTSSSWRATRSLRAGDIVCAYLPVNAGHVTSNAAVGADLRHRTLPHHSESAAVILAPADAVFDYVDDHEHLSSHMGQSSWMMGKGRLTTELDESHARQVGSRIRLSGKVLGMHLCVVEEVTIRDPPRYKVWETTAPPRLLLIGHYRMGIEITPRQDASLLLVFVDYELPDSPPERWLARLFGGVYAKWCTRQMADGVARHFNDTHERMR